MKIVKESQGGQSTAVTGENMALINALARRELKPEEVYTFSVRLCDNEVDRDFERFPAETLEALAGMFVGKTGIFDHQWSARGQAARIYKTEMVYEPERVTRAGDGYCWLKGYAYMAKTAGTEDLIAEIEAGIKKEVSVGCAVERSVCSVCGADMRNGDCGHVKGEMYGGKLCYASLEGASDAYEFSFVAVPAQPGAGVVKGFASLKVLAAKYPGCREELERLEEEARTGREYLASLRRDAVRMGLLAGLGLEQRTLKAMADKLSAGELIAMREAYEKKAAERYPLKTQLEYGEKEILKSEDQAFLV